MAGARLDEFPAAARKREVLEAPLGGEQESQGADVGVLVVADVLGLGGAGAFVFGVSEQPEGGEGWAWVGVVGLEAGGAG